MRLNERLNKIGITVSERNFYSTYEILEECGSIEIETLLGRSVITLSEARIVASTERLSNLSSWSEILKSAISQADLLRDVRIAFFGSAGIRVDPEIAERIDIQSTLIDIDNDEELSRAAGAVIWGLDSIISSVQATREFEEGGEVVITSKRYERSKALRIEAVRHHGVNCCICDFNFSKTYGEIGAGFIHIHHIDRVADSGVRIVDVEKDLIPICPNCHAMIHRETPPMNPEKLKQIMKDASGE